MEKSLILTRAKNATISHDFVTAARLYKELLRDDESNVEYLKQLGSIYVQSGEDEKAIPYYSQIITFYPHYIDAMNSLGAIYRRLHRYQESIDILQRALDEDRQLPAVNYNLGYTYREMGNYKDAIESFEKVIRVNPDDVLAYNHLGSVYYAQKEYEKAVASYKRGLQIDHNHPILNYNLAKVYEALKNYPDAVRCYQTALRTKPGWTDAIKDYTALLVNNKNSKEATEIIQQGIKLYPNNTEMLRILGDIYLGDYDYPAAEQTFKKACSIKPNDVDALVGLSKALEKSDKSEYALDAALSAIELEPTNREAKKQYAQSLLSEKDYESAKDAVASLCDEEGKKDIQVWDLRGQYFICNEEDEKAKACYETIKHLNHHYKEYMVNAANRYAQIGKFEKAEIYANEFIVHRPDNIDGYNTLGKINYLKEDFVKATEYYKKACSLGKNNVLAEKQIKTISDQVEREKLFAEKYVQITGEPLNKEPIDLPVVSPEAYAAEPEKEDESFDFSSVGSVTPLQEGLTGKEADYFKADDDISPARKEDEKFKEALSNAANPAETPFDIFDDDNKNALEEDESVFSFGDFVPETNIVNTESDKGDRDNNSTVEENSVEKVEESEQVNIEQVEQNPALQSKTEEALLDALDKVRELEQQRYKEQDDRYEQMLQDVMETPADEQPVQNMDDFLNAEEAVETEENTETEEAEVAPAAEEMSAEEMFAEDIPEADENSQLNEVSEKVIDDNILTDDFLLNGDNDSSVTSPKDMLEKIEKILSDDDVAVGNAEKIEMFKKLRVLCDYLPETEKNTFQSCRNRMIIDYIIAKMSGKPGLLVTALSLLKSGVLGEDYTAPAGEEEAEEISNEMVSQVILNMQKMAENLDDKYLSQALRASADDILERIEIENQKAQIF